MPYFQSNFTILFYQNPFGEWTTLVASSGRFVVVRRGCVRRSFVHVSVKIVEILSQQNLLAALDIGLGERPPFVASVGRVSGLVFPKFAI